MVVLKPYQEILGIDSDADLVQLFLATLAETNRTHDFYVDWNKVRRNIQSLRAEIALLGSLAGSQNPLQELRDLLTRYPEASKAIPIIIAVRDLKFTVLEDIDADEKYREYNFSKPTLSSYEIDAIVQFCDRTGIASLLTSLQTLRDYIFGVEVGIDTNARKNRSGTSMERLIVPLLDNLSAEHSAFSVRTQRMFSELARVDGVSIPASLNDRRFDIVVFVNDQRFNIETNFYAGTGSKPQEIVDSYINRHRVLSESGWKFIWVTDGYGWLRMGNQMRRAFREMDYILNIEFVRKGVLTAILDS